MVKFLNATGGEMLVAEERAEEYKAAGFMPVADSEPKPKAPAKKPATKKKTEK